MEIVKIQMQLIPKSPTSSQGAQLLNVIQSLGLRGLYRGTLATLCRDVPFSIMFFQGFASFRHLLRDADSSSPQLGVTLAAGMIAGAISALFVTPMDGIHSTDDDLS